MRSEVVPQAGGSRQPRSVAVAARAGRTVCVAVAGVVAACGGPARSQIAIGPPPPRDTHAVLAGGLCLDNRCTCRTEGGDGGAGVPQVADHKRFELHLASAHDLWVTIDGTAVLYKSPERADACFYVDLSTGSHQVELRASNPDGVSAGLEIHELGTRTHSWYDTFAFSCGVPGVCSFEDLDANKARLAATKNHVFDPCGTVKIKGITWDHGKAPDQIHPSELVVRLTLDIYRFAAWKEHGDATCGVRGGRPPADEPTPPPDETP